MVILHISDLHLEKSTEADTISYVVKPLIDCIKTDNPIRKIDLILFSGDLIDKGGNSYKSIHDAFLRFGELFMYPLLEATNLDESRFFIVPGNHDISRVLDSKIIEKGISNELISENLVNSFITNCENESNYEGIKRILPFKEFESFIYSGIENKKLSNFSSSFILDIDGLSIGISCFNSSWRCYDSNTDKGHILIGEYQVDQSINFIKDCIIKIAVSHHALDELKEFDKKIINARLQALYDMHFTGHVHQPDADYRLHSYGKLYRSIASGTLSTQIRENQANYENGFSIIDYNIEEKQITTFFYKLDHLKNAFVPNNALGDDFGVFRIAMLSEHELLISNEKAQVISNICSDNISKVDSHLINYQTDTKAPKTVDELFVMPTIEYGVNLDPDEEPEVLKDIKELINSVDNFVIFGTKESGKTILLDKILIDQLKEKDINSKIPVYINFSDVSGSDLIQSIKNFMGVNSKTAINLMTNYGVLFLIDNIKFDDSEKYRLKNLNELLTAYPKSRVIATYSQLYKDEFPIEDELSNIITYEKVTIRDFKTKQIRTLIKKWFKDNDKYETPKKLQTILTAFQTLSLPRTPFAVSLFLWIIEKQENSRPINNSSLIENFIEKLLDKHNKNEILAERFDYKNQIRLLAEIAHFMYEKDDLSYRISFADLTNFVQGYIHSRQFNLSTSNIVNRLINSGLFTYDYQEANYLRFRFSCFFEFFLVRKMEFTPSFKAEVLSEENYLKFINEIDYYTGLHREETELLEVIIGRMNFIYEDLNSSLPKDAKSIDELFNTKESVVAKLDQKKFVKYLPQSKPTEEDLDIEEDKRLEMNDTEGIIEKKESNDSYRNLSKILVLAMRILKNSEEISKSGLKQSAFETIVKNSISFAVIYKITLQQYLEDHDSDEFKDLRLANRYLPLLHELFLFDNMGTLKLSNIIKTKIDNDITSRYVSEFEKYMTVFLYADIRGPKYTDYISALIKSSKRNYILDMTFFKILTYYLMRSKEESTDNQYLNMIGDIFVKTTGQSKSYIIQKFKDRKQESSRQLSLDFE